MKITCDAIIEYADRIAALFKPQRIILFGSYAYGEPSRDSDVDVMVISNRSMSEIDQAIKIRRKIPADFPVDLLVKRERDIADRIAMNDFFLAEVMQKGLPLYAADNARMGEQGRRRLRHRLRVAQVA